MLTNNERALKFDLVETFLAATNQNVAAHFAQARRSAEMAIEDMRDMHRMLDEGVVKLRAENDNRLAVAFDQNRARNQRLVAAARALLQVLDDPALPELQAKGNPARVALFNLARRELAESLMCEPATALDMAEGALSDEDPRPGMDGYSVTEGMGIPRVPVGYPHYTHAFRPPECQPMAVTGTREPHMTMAVGDREPVDGYSRAAGEMLLAEMLKATDPEDQDMSAGQRMAAVRVNLDLMGHWLKQMPERWKAQP